jgi:hypothetical protein
MLAHESPGSVAGHVDLITSADPEARVFVHYDGKVPEPERQDLADRLSGNAQAKLVAKRVKCRWGGFGLVQAALNGLREIRELGFAPDYVYLISGSCLPVRPLAELNRYLDAHAGTEFIQAEDERWITGGLRDERYRYYFPLGWQEHRALFDLLVKVQRRGRVRRTFPRGLQPRFGSQWWCLTWSTCQAILEYIDKNPDVPRFFRLTWIPDECFFQTLVYHLAGPRRLSHTTLTLYRFGATGKPIVFFDEHEAWLFGQNFFFARKVSPEAKQLKEKIRTLSRAPDRGKPLMGIGRSTPFYEAATWLRRQRERPGQMFRFDQRRGNYPGALARNENPYLALFGPPVATRIAAEALRRQGVQVFGHLFDPQRVDFGLCAHQVHGLTPRDNEIRDFGPSLYLARVLDRSARGPAFEVSIWDRPAAAYLSHDDPNCLFVACLPRPDVIGPASRWNEKHWRFYRDLYLLDCDARIAELAAVWSDVVASVREDRLWSYEGTWTSEGGEEILRWARNKGLVQPDKPNFLVLPWGGGVQARDSALKAWQSVQSQWGHAADVPAGAMESAIAALSEFDIEDVLAAAPRVVRDRVAASMVEIGLDPVRWVDRELSVVHTKEQGAHLRQVMA